MRAETGPMKFSKDWRGVFIRGDDAFAFVYQLQRALEGDKLPTHLVLGLERLLDLLNSSDERHPSPDVQQMKPFEECIPKRDA